MLDDGKARPAGSKIAEFDDGKARPPGSRVSNAARPAFGVLAAGEAPARSGDDVKRGKLSRQRA